VSVSVSACPRCGAVLADPDRFCRACGTPVANAVERAAAVPYRLILAIIGMLVGTSVLIALLITLKRVVFYIVIAAFLALVVNPAVDRLQRWRFKRGSAIALTVVVLFIAVAGIGTLMAAPLATQAAHFASEAPGYLHDAQVNHRGPIYDAARKLHLEKQIDKIGPGLSNTLRTLSEKVLELGRRVASAVFAAAIVVILAIFMLAEGPKLTKSAIALIPDDHRQAAQRVGQTAARVVSGYTTGVLIMAVLNGIVAGLAMWLTGTPFVLPLAVWATVVDILPIVGGLLAVIPAALFAFIHSVTAGIVVVVAILLYQQIKNHVLYPVLIGRAVQMSSLLVLVAVLAGTELGHVSGAILAIPVAGVLQAVIQEVGRYRREQRALVEAQAPTVAVTVTVEAEAAVPGMPARTGLLRRIAARRRKR
jgi:predicted PurR-regulated permease PerM